jgi:predicted acyltransferase
MEADLERQEIDGARRVMSLDALRGFDMFWIIGGGRTSSFVLFSGGLCLLLLGVFYLLIDV